MAPKNINKIVLSSVEEALAVKPYRSEFLKILRIKNATSQYSSLSTLASSLEAVSSTTPAILHNSEFNTLVLQVSQGLNVYQKEILNSKSSHLTMSLLNIENFLVSSVAIPETYHASGAAGAALATTPEPSPNNGKEEIDDGGDASIIDPQVSKEDNSWDISSYSDKLGIPNIVDISKNNFIQLYGLLKNVANSTIGPILIGTFFLTLTPLGPILENVTVFAASHFELEYVSSTTFDLILKAKSKLSSMGAVHGTSSFVDIPSDLKVSSVESMHFFYQNNIIENLCNTSHNNFIGYQASIRLKELEHTVQILLYLAGDLELASSFNVTTAIAPANSLLDSHLICKLLNAEVSEIEIFLEKNSLFTSQIYILSDQFQELLDMHTLDEDRLNTVAKNNLYKIKIILEYSHKLIEDRLEFFS